MFSNCMSRKAWQGRTQVLKGLFKVKLPTTDLVILSNRVRAGKVIHGCLRCTGISRLIGISREYPVRGLNVGDAPLPQKYRYEKWI